MAEGAAVVESGSRSFCRWREQVLMIILRYDACRAGGVSMSRYSSASCERAQSCLRWTPHPIQVLNQVVISLREASVFRRTSGAVVTAAMVAIVTAVVMGGGGVVEAKFRVETRRALT